MVLRNRSTTKAIKVADILVANPVVVVAVQEEEGDILVANRVVVVAVQEEEEGDILVANQVVVVAVQEEEGDILVANLAAVEEGDILVANLVAVEEDIASGVAKVGDTIEVGSVALNSIWHQSPNTKSSCATGINKTLVWYCKNPA